MTTRTEEPPAVIVESLDAVPPDAVAVACCGCGAMFACDFARLTEANVLVREHRMVDCRPTGSDHCAEYAVRIGYHNYLASGPIAPLTFEQYWDARTSDYWGDYFE